ncbi:MAG: hypothetical protein AB7N76_30570 [Planctomycetota bacterium]
MKIRHGRTFTVLEVMIASAILMTMIGMAMVVSAETGQNVGDTLAISDTALRSNRVAADLNLYLRSAQEYVLSPTATGYTQNTAAQFRSILGYDFDGKDSDGVTDNNGVSRSPVRLIRFVYDAGETGNGADDDGDGLIDEGRLELCEDANNNGSAADSGETLMTFATDVQASSLNFQILPSFGSTPIANTDCALQISFTLLKRLPSNGQTYTYTQTVDIAFRNRLD